MLLIGGEAAVEGQNGEIARLLDAGQRPAGAFDFADAWQEDEDVAIVAENVIDGTGDLIDADHPCRRGTTRAT